VRLLGGLQMWLARAPATAPEAGAVPVNCIVTAKSVGTCCARGRAHSGAIAKMYPSQPPDAPASACSQDPMHSRAVKDQMAYYLVTTSLLQGYYIVTTTLLQRKYLVTTPLLLRHSKVASRES
jgi:hypothetical protein